MLYPKDGRGGLSLPMFFLFLFLLTLAEHHPVGNINPGWHKDEVPETLVNS